MLNINEQDRQVAQFLADNKITVSHQFMGFAKNINGQNWDADRFLIKFKEIEFEFNVGIGNRLSGDKLDKGCYSGSVKCRAELSELRGIYSNCIKVLYPVDFVKSGYDKAYRTLAVAPTPASVLYCLLSDSQASDYNFNDWCDDYGYDNDSIEAFNTYQKCCNTGKSLLKVFTHTQIEALREMLQDY